MRIFLPFLAAVITVIFLACGNGGSSDGEFASSAVGQESMLTFNESAAFATPAPAASAPAASFAPRAAQGEFGDDGHLSALPCKRRKERLFPQPRCL